MSKIQRDVSEHGELNVFFNLFVVCTTTPDRLTSAGVDLKCRYLRKMKNMGQCPPS